MSALMKFLHSLSMNSKGTLLLILKNSKDGKILNAFQQRIQNFNCTGPDEVEHFMFIA